MQNAYLLANIGLDTAKDGPSEGSLKNKEPGGGVKNVKRSISVQISYMYFKYTFNALHRILYCSSQASALE